MYVNVLKSVLGAPFMANISVICLTYGRTVKIFSRDPELVFLHASSIWRSKLPNIHIDTCYCLSAFFFITAILAVCEMIPSVVLSCMLLMTNEVPLFIYLYNMWVPFCRNAYLRPYVGLLLFLLSCRIMYPDC